MNLKIFLFLLWNCSNGEKDASTTPVVKYPCDNRILFGFENSLELDKFAFQRQKDFLLNHVFENWTHFNELAILTTGELRIKDLFDSKSDLKGYIQSLEQIESTNTACDVFTTLSDKTIKSLRLVLFLNEFDLSDIADKCFQSLQGLILTGNSFAFVPLSDKFNETILEHYFKQAKIFEWNITEETPDEWKEQFNDFYNCGDQTATTIEFTKQPTILYPSCSNFFAFAFDKSNGLTEDDYKLEQDFLINYVFKKWNRFDRLEVYSFADHSYSNIVPFENRDELTEFIRGEEQSDADPDLCNFLHTYLSFADKKDYALIFLSKFNETYWNSGPCQSLIDEDFYTHLTFVVLTEEISTTTLKKHIKQAQFIKLNLSEVQTNWEWYFNTAYGCNEDDYNDKSMYPCNSKFIFAYDVSTEMNVLKKQQDFLINNVFNKDWNVFNNLALVAYSNSTQTQDFGTLKNLNDIHSFIDSTTNQNSASSISLCSLFNQLTTMYIQEVNIVLFVNEFHEGIGDECTNWIEELRNNINFIHFIVLSKNVNVDYLLFHFSQARITSLNNENNWDATCYGCQNFVVTSKAYPCSFENTDDKIIFDRSHYLSPFAYQRLTNFLLDNVFIRQWTEHFYIYTYPNHTKTFGPDRSRIEMFIRQSLRSKKEPLICQTLYDTLLTTSRINLLFFVSKMDESVLPNTTHCKRSVNSINSPNNNVTFVALSSLVNETFLLENFPDATVIDWDIENEELPPTWNDMLWEAFGCSGESPIVFPHSTSTVIPTTRSLTSTVKSSSVRLSSTTQVSTKKSSTSTLTTTTVHTSSLKTTTSKGMPKEVVILLAVFIPLLAVVVLGFIACFYLYRRKQRQQLVTNMAENNFNRTNKACDEKREEDPWNISEDCLHINYFEKLGSGAFGDVFIAKLIGDAPIKNIYSDSPHCQRFHDIDVAVKALPSVNVDEYARNEFWKEIDFMKGLKFHPNLVCFLGYVSDPTNPLMILEYCANGDLLKFIKTNKQKFVESFESQESPKTLVSFAWQISSGLEYLGSLGLIHRDIAARNVLLDKNNVCKVSDFGLCRTGGDGQLYLSSGGKLPVKWMAPESLKQNVFSNKTDVWSYGVLLWELYTLGNLPYSDVESVLVFLESGQRLSKPEYSTDEIYEIMLDCWQVDPEDRPTFTIICQLLTKMIETATLHYNYVDTLALIEEANQIEEINE